MHIYASQDGLLIGATDIIRDLRVNFPNMNLIGETPREDDSLILKFDYDRDSVDVHCLDRHISHKYAVSYKLVPGKDLRDYLYILAVDDEDLGDESIAQF